ncbi:MAG: NADH-quinone oxidoreductase subunit L [Candidatus Baltobacteraceae bacterium]
MMLYALWLVPLLGAVVLWAFGPLLRRISGGVGSVTIAISFLLTLALWGGATSGGIHQALVTWMPGFELGLALDPLSLLWALIITGVGGLIHVYSIGYMAGDRGAARFFAYMNFFVFAMLTLVLSDNFVGLLVGWGLVGLASYFLIGYWFDRPAAVAAARKAFVINVVGDVGLMFAIFVLFANLHTAVYADVFAGIAQLGPSTLFVVCVAIFIACAAKSAQVPLQTWLPDAMEGPTPVSALIHAATMVTAGVYLVARCAPLWNASPGAQELVGMVGAVTALAGAILGLAQWDIKRVLAYSTMSQIGYMIMGVGVGAYSAGVLHFFTHAFFKAQLFLASGLVIHALHDEQDIRRMGGLRRTQPFAFWAMLVGTLSICGVPGLAGFFSKDAVIYGTLERGHVGLYLIGVLTAGITAYYMFRMIFVAFAGTSRQAVPAAELGMDGQSPDTHPASEPHPPANVPEWVMQLPVAVLMVPTVIAGYVSIGGDASPWSNFFGSLFEGAPAATLDAGISEIGSTLLVFAVVAVGFAVAFARYGTSGAKANAVERLGREARTMPAVLARGYFVDDAIEMLFVRPAQALGIVFARFVDPHVLEGAVRDFSWLAGALGLVARRWESGFVRGYAITIVVGVAVFLAYYVFGVAR